MKQAYLLAIFLAVLSLSAFAQDASTVTSTSATCCTLRFSSLEFQFAEVPSVRISLDWLDSEGMVKRQEYIGISDGDAATVEDNWLTGTGVSPQPNGLLRAILTAPTGETGPIPRRFRRRVLQWLKDNTKLSDTGITIQ